MDDYKYFPDKEYRFFVLDPMGDTCYFKTKEARDDYASQVIMLYLDDGWSEGVDDIIAGEITHHTIMCNVQIKPEREDFDSEEDFDDAMCDYPNDSFDWCCSYELAPIEEEGEKAPK